MNEFLFEFNTTINFYFYLIFKSKDRKDIKDPCISIFNKVTKLSTNEKYTIPTLVMGVNNKTKIKNGKTCQKEKWKMKLLTLTIATLIRKRMCFFLFFFFCLYFVLMLLWFFLLLLLLIVLRRREQVKMRSLN